MNSLSSPTFIMPILDTSNSIDLPESDYLYTQTSQILNSGLGLYTAIEIFKDEVISLFEGELLTSRVADERAYAGNDKYFIKLLNGKILDSMHVPCFAKFANDAQGHSVSKFLNNCKISLDENEQVCLIATRKINANEEIFCSYGKQYWLNQLSSID